jgi:hypothetical protein
LRVEWVEAREGQRTVYDLEVEQTHTFVVGKLGAWVHNTCAENLTVVKDGAEVLVKSTLDSKAGAQVVRMGGAVHVMDICRGGLPVGSGSEILAKALGASGVRSGEQVVFSGIMNAEAIAACQANWGGADSLLGGLGSKALGKLGLEASNFEFRMSEGWLDLIIGVR